MPAAPDVASDRGVTRVEWLICTVAGLGFAFEIGYIQAIIQTVRNEA